MMDFDGAIKAHTVWKMKLSTYLKNPDGSLKPADIQMDNKCDLGKWIYGDGTQYKNLPEYNTLKAEHTKFHQCAADVVRKADSGQSVSEEIALGAKSDFSTASNAVISAIMKMKSKSQ